MPVHAAPDGVQARPMTAARAPRGHCSTRSIISSPLDAGPLTVGVGGRRVFPAPVPGLPGTSHAEPPDTVSRPPGIARRALCLEGHIEWLNEAG